MNNRRNEEMTRWWLGWVGHIPRVTSLLLDKPWASAWVVPKVANSMLRGTGIVAFANSPLSGIFILAGMFVGNPDVGWACLLAGLVGVIFGKILKQPEDLISDGVVLFNGILVSCISVAVFPSLSGHEIDGMFWIALLVILIVTAYIDKGLNALMAPSKLPALSIPFNIAAALMLLSLRGSVGLTGMTGPLEATENTTTATAVLNATESEAVDWVKVMEGTVLSAGQIYGVSTMESSILILLGFLVFSPILTIAFILGGAIGSVLGVIFTQPPYLDVYAGLWGYNSMLTTGAIAYFVHVTPQSVLGLVIGAVLTALTQAASLHVFSAMTVPVLSYPFNVATLLILATTTTSDPPIVWVKTKTFPEDHLYLYVKEQWRRNRVAEVETQMPLSDSSK